MIGRLICAMTAGLAFGCAATTFAFFVCLTVDLGDGPALLAAVPVGVGVAVASGVVVSRA
jgi:hypothetical protein